MQDKYRKRRLAPTGGDRTRRQIAVEAARRLVAALDEIEAADPVEALRDVSTTVYYNAKRRAAAVLGHHVRPGDLPSDEEVRAEILTYSRHRSSTPATTLDHLEPAPDALPLGPLAAHLERFALYKLRLEPLERVKQNPRTHPEGDALYHSLQVFERARAVRPYDEEFLLAALLHDVGKAIEPKDHVAASVEALRGAVTERTLWLVAHHAEAHAHRQKTLAADKRRDFEASEYFEDAALLRELDEAAREPGAIVPSVDEALNYIRALDAETFLDA